MLQALILASLIAASTAGSSKAGKNKAKVANQTQTNATDDQPDKVGNMTMGGHPSNSFDLNKFIENANDRIERVIDRLDQPEDAGNMETGDGYTYNGGAGAEFSQPDVGEMKTGESEESQDSKEFVKGVLKFAQVVVNMVEKVGGVAEGVKEVAGKAIETANHGG